MDQQYLTNELLYHSFILGAKNVINGKNDLNSINVFPVPDGDTGSNLSSMMRSILEHAKLGKTTDETLQSIADAAIIGARGNSGIIFAQYIYGFAMSAKEDLININHFIDISKNAFSHAYKAISKPVEGTMITLMRSFSQAVESFKSASANFKDLIAHAYDRIMQDLKKTPDLLPVLKENHVVDAGAKGFVYFIEGFVKAINGEQVELEQVVNDHIEELHVDHLEDSTFRYCTEALLKGSSLDIEAMRQTLSQFGDSLVIAGGTQKMRIHIHSNQPDKVFEYLDSMGTIIEQKVDDMRRQYEAANHQKYEIALVTDSIADLPESLVDYYQIHMFPLNLLIHDVSYLDKVTIKNDRFYQLMDQPGSYPTSSQPNAKSVENYFSFLTTYYKKILVLTVSKQMSGTHQVFKDAAEKFSGFDIRVIDSKQNSGAEGLLVLEAAKLIEQKKSLDLIVETLEQKIKQSRILVSVKTLKYMVKAGRITKTKGLVAKIMNLKPIISIEDGAGIIFEKGLSLKSTDKKIFEHLKSIMESDGISSYAIVHANADDRVKVYQEKLTALLKKEPTYVMEISTIVAMNAGVGSVGVAYIRGDH